jgi:hypothetical protein
LCRRYIAEEAHRCRWAVLGCDGSQGAASSGIDTPQR